MEVFSGTMRGREKEVVRVVERGAQIRPLVWRIMKAMFSVVACSAAMARSPSFSRSVESRIMMNLPCSRGVGC